MRYQGGSIREAFGARLGFDLDPFQLEAMDALDAGHSVVVAAPTGSGKTLVAEYAVGLALSSGGKAFYTTPLKALSNQKFSDFGRWLGAGKVGLLTGDNAVNPDAQVVVMTTEVLRNMVYAGSQSLEGLRYVVLDEVHYLQDPYRGPVWEEVMIHLPPEVDLVCLSATVSNAEELADWVGTVRGSTRAVIEERRPVPLHNLFLAGERRHRRLVLLPTLVGDQANPKGTALTARGDGPGRQHRREGLYVPRRAETVGLLHEMGLLPAIYFIFSRAGCDEAVRQCVREGGRLTSASERQRIAEVADQVALSGLTGGDLEALGYGAWLGALQAGFAAHHAGLVPPFKEAVERCFAAGLVKVVFATETLALGVNMPARSVVIEKLAKFGGERVEPLTPGEYTQLTGRAGRRGTDEVGYAIVAWSPLLSFDQVAALAGARSYTLSSSFRPTYNMATNLVARCSPARARHLLNLSFAQYRADADVVRLESRIERSRGELERARQAAHCELGDVWEYRRLAGRADAPGTPGAAAGPAGDGPAGGGPSAVGAALGLLRPGDVLMVSPRRPAGRKRAERMAVVSTAQRRSSGTSVRALTVGHKLVMLTAGDFQVPPRPVARVELPTPFAPRSREFQRRLARSLAECSVADDHLPGRSYSQRAAGLVARAHPVARCPDLAEHVRAVARAERLELQIGRLVAQVEARSGSLARQFDRVLEVLEQWGYVQSWSLTDCGRRLARIYHPQDLLVAECARQGLFDGLEPAEIAALASVFTYEARGPAASQALTARLPTPRLDQRWRSVQELARQLALDEAARGVPGARSPDAGFAALAYGWASGQELNVLLALPDLPGAAALALPAGDFVRNVKQLVDLLRQLGEVLAEDASAKAAKAAAAALFRGVVAASSAVGAIGAAGGGPQAAAAGGGASGPGAPGEASGGPGGAPAGADGG